jgi:hypothetical protein
VAVDPCPGVGVLDPHGLGVHVDLVTCLRCTRTVRVAAWVPDLGHVCPRCHGELAREDDDA